MRNAREYKQVPHNKSFQIIRPPLLIDQYEPDYIVLDNLRGEMDPFIRLNSSTESKNKLFSQYKLIASHKDPIYMIMEKVDAP